MSDNCFGELSYRTIVGLVSYLIRQLFWRAALTDNCFGAVLSDNCFCVLCLVELLTVFVNFTLENSFDKLSGWKTACFGEFYLVRKVVVLMSFASSDNSCFDGLCFVGQYLSLRA